MAPSAAMISFRCIMPNININIHTIDFSSLAALKEREFQSREVGGSVALNLIWWFHVSIDILKFRLVWSPVQYPCLTPSSDFTPQREMDYSERKQGALISPPSSLFYKFCATLSHRTTERLWGSVFQHFHREKRPSMWVFSENPTPSVSSGINNGHLQMSKVVCVIVLVIKPNPLLEDRSSLAAVVWYKILKRRILSAVQRGRGTVRNKTSNRNWCGKKIRQQSESGYMIVIVCSANRAQL